MAYRAFILIGGPGSGKGTQGKVLGSVLNFRHLSSGDMFRGIDRESEIGKKITGYMDRGELIPDDITLKLFTHHLESLVARGAFNPSTDVLVLDGIPRNLNQAKILSNSIDLLGVIHLDIGDDEVLFERMRGRALKENRSDDADPDVVRRRIEVFKTEVMTLLSCYEAEKIHRVEGHQQPIRVLYDIITEVLKATGL